MGIPVLTQSTAVDVLRDCLGGLGEIKPCKSFLEDLVEEELSLPDVWRVLKIGRILEEPWPDVATGEWLYKIEGRTIDGVWIEVVFSFREINRTCLLAVSSVEDRED
jgi:hypothetical protein